MERKLLDMMNQLSISEYNPRMKYCDKFKFWEQEKSRLEDKLVNKIFKCFIRFLIEVIVMTVLIVGINIFMNGMYLWGLPHINDIQSVNITYPSVTDAA